MASQTWWEEDPNSTDLNEVPDHGESIERASVKRITFLRVMCSWIKTGIQRIEESTAKIETDRLLERMDEKLYRQVKKNLRDELDSARGDLEQCRLHIQETVDQKRWIDWVGKFHEMYDDVDHLSPEDRKDYLEGVVDRLTVNLDPKTNEHVIDITFKFPIVGDQLDYLDGSLKSKRYEVVDGQTTQSVRGSFVSKHDGVKKKTNGNGLDGIRTRTLEQSPSQWNRFHWINSDISKYFLRVDVTVKIRSLTIPHLPEPRLIRLHLIDDLHQKGLNSREIADHLN